MYVFFTASHISLFANLFVCLILIDLIPATETHKYSPYFLQIGTAGCRWSLSEVNNGEYPYWSSALTPTSVRPDVGDAQEIPKIGQPWN